MYIYPNVLGIHVTNTHQATWRILADDYLNESSFKGHRTNPYSAFRQSNEFYFVIALKLFQFRNVWLAGAASSVKTLCKFSFKLSENSSN